jgi:hypothetical protein
VTPGKGGRWRGRAGGAGGDGVDDRYPTRRSRTPAWLSTSSTFSGTWGNRYWFAVSDAQLALMNQADLGGGQDGLYQPAAAAAMPTGFDHLFITTAGDRPRTADYGKVQARIVGQYSRFPWTPQTIPNLNIDADQFIEAQRIAGYEHLRFSNGQRGSIFRDKLAYDLYRMLDYPAPLATVRLGQSNVWGPSIQIPILSSSATSAPSASVTLEEFGGGCPNMWEFVATSTAAAGVQGPTQSRSI